ncbi:XRE family transcriptional regulator [Streptomyces daqingensis]|uniref:XRE family transcriptional regulator n=1 Tax=Streptomyces daqingensis TaxID=1472640 RepID=A0ABQ2LYW6_9ACTN|nr:XRE family transcriptional regulator [Streptomyces daqingensis]GGO44786.1 XRE family transcriptional regulator [Streptomyces daqingensis]
MPRKPEREPDGSAGEFADPEGVSAAGGGGELATIGTTVRSTRRLLGMTVEALASRAGVSTGALSQLERGQGNPSLQTLQRLASALSLPLVQLLQGAAEPEHHVVRAGHGPRLPAPSDDTREPQVLRELLTPSGGRLQVIRSEVPPGFSNEGRSYRHLGQECVVVLSGRLRVSIGQEVVDLSQGDTITYDCTAAHWWANPGTETTVVLGAVTPLAF